MERKKEFVLIIGLLLYLHHQTWHTPLLLILSRSEGGGRIIVVKVGVWKRRIRRAKVRHDLRSGMGPTFEVGCPL